LRHEDIIFLLGCRCNPVWLSIHAADLDCRCVRRYLSLSISERSPASSRIRCKPRLFVGREGPFKEAFPSQSFRSSDVTVIVVPHTTIVVEVEQASIGFTPCTSGLSSLLLYFVCPSPLLACVQRSPGCMFVQYCLEAVLDPTCFGCEVRSYRLSTYGRSAVTQLTPILTGCLHGLFVCAKPIYVPVRRCFTFSLGRSKTE
jgi:hypothetical protein